MATDNSLIPSPGSPITADWARRLAQAIRAARPVAGNGVRVANGPNGAVISVASQPAAKAAAAEEGGLHPWKVEYRVPEGETVGRHEIYIPPLSLTADGVEPDGYGLLPAGEDRPDWYLLDAFNPGEPVILAYELDLTDPKRPAVSAWFDSQSPAGEGEIEAGKIVRACYLASLTEGGAWQHHKEAIAYESPGVRTLNKKMGDLSLKGDEEGLTVDTPQGKIKIYAVVKKDENAEDGILVSISDEPQSAEDEKEAQEDGGSGYCNTISNDSPPGAGGAPGNGNDDGTDDGIGNGIAADPGAGGGNDQSKDSCNF